MMRNLITGWIIGDYMIILTKDAHITKKQLSKLIQQDNVIILDGKREGVYPKFKVLAIHKRTADNVVRYSLGLPLLNTDGIILNNQ